MGNKKARVWPHNQFINHTMRMDGYYSVDSILSEGNDVHS